MNTPIVNQKCLELRSSLNGYDAAFSDVNESVRQRLKKYAERIPDVDQKAMKRIMRKI